MDCELFRLMCIHLKKDPVYWRPRPPEHRSTPLTMPPFTGEAESVAAGRSFLCHRCSSCPPVIGSRVHGTPAYPRLRMHIGQIKMPRKIAQIGICGSPVVCESVRLG